MSKITVIGPNLYDQRTGIFHVHAADCRDGWNARKYPISERMDMDADTVTEVLEFIYSDHAGDHGYVPGMPEYDAYIAECRSDFHFHRCCGLD
jgi:hypothetical protein